MEFSLGDISEFLPSLLRATGTTIVVTILSMLCATAIGLLTGLVRAGKHGILYYLVTIYVDFMRGTPLLLQIFYIYYVLPLMGLDIPAFQAGVLSLSLNYGAYLSEVFRAGIQAVPKGQVEGAQAIGLHPAQILFLVVVPQAVRIVIPPIGNYFVALFKDSSLVSVIGITELMRAGQLMAAVTYKHFAIYTMVGVIYLLISYPSTWFLTWLQKRMEAAPMARAAAEPA